MKFGGSAGGEMQHHCYFAQFPFKGTSANEMHYCVALSLFSFHLSLTLIAPCPLSSPRLPTAESFTGKGKYLKRIRYHGRGMFGIMDKVYCNYFVKLVEGSPPKTEKTTAFDQAKEYVQSLKNRTIIHSL